MQSVNKWNEVGPVEKQRSLKPIYSYHIEQVRELISIHLVFLLAFFSTILIDFTRNETESIFASRFFLSSVSRMPFW
jgi:hypothetical protein